MLSLKVSLHKMLKEKFLSICMHAFLGQCFFLTIGKFCREVCGRKGRIWVSLCPCFPKQNPVSLVVQELVYKSIHIQFEQQSWKVCREGEKSLL